MQIKTANDEYFHLTKKLKQSLYPSKLSNYSKFNINVARLFFVSILTTFEAAGAKSKIGVSSELNPFENLTCLNR
jgi:hypothetical protein